MVVQTCHLHTTMKTGLWSINSVNLRWQNPVLTHSLGTIHSKKWYHARGPQSSILIYFLRLKIWRSSFLRFEDLKTALFCHFLTLDLALKTEDLKTAYLTSEDSKYAFMCWRPHIVWDAAPSLCFVAADKADGTYKTWWDKTLPVKSSFDPNYNPITFFFCFTLLGS